MARKKLTKVRVKAEYKKIAKIIAFLFKDRMEHPDSNVTLSAKSMFEIDSTMKRAFNRVK